MEKPKHPLHLKNSELQKSAEVARAVSQKERQTGEKVPNDPAKRIEAYMSRLENVFLNPAERKRNLEMLRPKIYDTLIVKRENFPESYFELQKRIARERGQAVEEIPADVREQMMDVAIEDQKHSLDAWIDYLSSNDAVYPPWFKYYVWTQVTKLSQFDKVRGEFKKRTDSTVAPFPDIYREPLAQIADFYERVKDDNKDSEARQEFDKKFPFLYAELIQKSLAAQIEGKEEIRGQWMKYEQGDSAAAEKLFQSLEGRGTGWCTAGRSTAETQIESGDFYVYYTHNKDDKPTQPRLAIRMEGNDRIGEVRGILPHQGVEPLMQEVLDEKLKDFGAEADAYRKKSEDMRHLTMLEQKQEKDETFTKENLRFLYELDGYIEGFGYQEDPRIEELRRMRSERKDLSIIYEIPEDSIALEKSEVGPHTCMVSRELRYEIAGAPNTPYQLLEELSKDADKYVANTAEWNKKTIEIEEKMKANKELDKKDLSLIWLGDTDASQILSLRAQRDERLDLAHLYDVPPHSVALNKDEVTKDTLVASVRVGFDDRIEIAKSEHPPLALLEEWAESIPIRSSTDLRQAIEENPHIPEGIRMKFIS